MPAAPYPAGPRVLAAVGAVGGLWLLVVDRPAGALALGCDWTALAMAAVALPLVGILALLAAAPERAEALLRRASAMDPRDPAHLFAAIVLWGTLYVMLGLGGIVSAVATLEETFGACALGATAPITGEAILWAVAVNTLIFTLPVLLYVAVVHRADLAGALARLGLRRENAASAAGLGVLTAVAFIVAIALVASLLLPFLPEEALQNDQALQIARSLTWLGALGLAIATGVGEEVFFRGFLQPRLGLWATSVIFALAHANYGSVSEVVVVFLLSLVMGILLLRTRNLMAPIAAHFAFNLIQLLLGIYGPEMAGA